MWFAKFRGGIHPDGFKELSAAKPIKQIPMPERLIVPLRQHAGSEAVPIVQPGQSVLKGQLIGRPGSGVSAPVHAPTSGTVLDVTAVVAPHPSGYESKAVIIETDGKDQPLPAHPPLNPYTLDRKKLASKVAEGGIVGLGGATFPTALKLHSAANQNIHTLIINGGECEPYLTADDRLMQERPVPIVEGARLLQYIVNADRIAIVVEDNKPEALKALQSAAKKYADVEIIKVPTRYPMGSSKQMIQVVTGQEVPAGRQSTEVGVLLYNVATAYATYYCLMENQPLVSRIVTVSGGAITEPQNVEALIGTPLSYLIEQCGGTNTTPARLLMGGPMMGQIMPTDEAPLIKGAGGILALKKDEINNTESSPCIRCSRCVGACPMGLMPLEMANHTRNNDFEGAVEYGLKDCILCGSCAYVCPSHIPLVHYFQFAKGEISQQKAIQHRTQYTRDLSDAKRIRKEQEAAEKAAAKAKRRRKPATSNQ